MDELRTFKKFPASEVCPICGRTDEEKRSVLIPIAGTQDGSICQAKAFHADCVINNINNLCYYKETGTLVLHLGKLK